MHDDRNYTLRDLVLRFCLKYFIHLVLGYFLICFLLGNEILEFYINEEFAFKSLNVYLIISFSATFAGVNLVFSNLFVILLKIQIYVKDQLTLRYKFGLKHPFFYIYLKILLLQQLLIFSLFSNSISVL